MADQITRRDFLDGFALGIAASLLPGSPLASAAAPPYPPALTGWRGSTPPTFEVAHEVFYGKRYALDRQAIDEHYDLVVIGAGIGGLAAAHYFRTARPGARILLLDNHDDFGGHARRNEFTVDGRLLIGYGGSEAIQSPETLWSKGARRLLADIGVDIRRFEAAFNRSLYPGLGLSRGLFFMREAFGVDKLVRGDPTPMVDDDIPPGRLNARSPAEFIADFPLPAEQQQKLLALYTERRDVFAGRSAAEKVALLNTISYRDFIMRHWGLNDQAADSFQGRSRDFFAIGIDGLPAYNAMETGYPGFQGMALTPDAGSLATMNEPYIYHFPDGNASLARLLVRALVPAAAPGRTMADVVTARFDYSQLDQRRAPVRLRLSSTVVAIRNSGAGVDIGYVRGGQLHRVQARQAIYAGYASMLPYICAEIGQGQREALAAGVKAPIAYVTVAVRNWQPWVRLGVHEITNPKGFFSRLKLDYPVSLGNYRSPDRPDQPILLHLVHVPSPPVLGLDQRSAWRAGRGLLQATSFADFEARVRDELTRMLGPGGFDAGRDIAAITVNRWGHGYAYSFNTLYDAVQDPPLYEIARRRVGRLAIAGSDAAWSAYAHAAIDEARRAAQELLRA